MYHRLITIILFVAAFLSTPGFSPETYAQTHYKYEDSYNMNRAMEALEDNNQTEAISYLNQEISQHKDNAYAYLLLQYIYNDREQYGEALTAAANALKYMPRKNKKHISDIYSKRAETYYALKQEDKALADHNAAVKVWPNEVEPLQNRGNFYFVLERYQESDADFLKVLKLDSENAYARMSLGRNCLAREEYQKAIDYFDYVIALYPDYSSGYSFRAEAYCKSGDYSGAALDIVRALEIDGNNKAFYMMTKDTENLYKPLSVRLKAKALAEKNNGYWPYCLGILNESEEKYGLAIDAYKKAMALDPDDITAYRIMNCYEELGNWKAALEYVDKAIEMDPEDINYKNAKANLYWFSDNLDSAIVEITKCVEAEPENYFYYHRRGWFKEHNNDEEGALEDYSNSIILNPSHAYSYMTRGRLYLNRGEKDLAEADFAKCTQLDTIPNGNSCAEFAWFYLGRNDKAIEYMDKLLAADSTGNYYDAACLYSIMGEKEKALDYLEQAFATGFKNFHHLDKDYDMDNIRDTERYKALLAQYNRQEPDADASTDAQQWVEKVVEVPFVKSGGVTKVKCEINGLPLSFIFDTGASVVSISSLEATFMYKNDYLTAKDIVGKSAFVDANGDISVGTIINLNKVTFGGLELENVRASVVSNDKAPLLLGQSVLNRLGKVEIDNEKSVLRITTKERVNN